jgi:hypothetical protein
MIPPTSKWNYFRVPRDAGRIANMTPPTTSQVSPLTGQWQQAAEFAVSPRFIRILQAFKNSLMFNSLQMLIPRMCPEAPGGLSATLT